MTRYLKVNLSGRFGDEHFYERLDDLTEYSDRDLEEMGADIVSNEYSWGVDVVEESEVPEDQR